MENQHYKSYEQAALEILRGNKPEEKQPVQQEQQKPETPQPLAEEQVEEAAVHPDALHVKPVKVGGQTKYKVHAVGKNYSDGIKVGEHLSDSELDDFSEMGGKIKHMKEEAEELDELSKDTLQSYMHKRRSDVPKRMATAMKDIESGMKTNRSKAQAVGLSRARDKLNKMEEVEEEDYDQLIEEKNAFELELPEQLTFAHYLNAAKIFTESYDDAIVVADHFFRNEDESLIVEAFTRSDIEDRVKMHQKAGNETTMPKYGMKNGKPYAEYTVTEKDSGRKTKYIHHGDMRRVERM